MINFSAHNMVLRKAALLKLESLTRFIPTSTVPERYAAVYETPSHLHFGTFRYFL
jgi:hypothetical protein